MAGRKGRLSQATTRLGEAVLDIEVQLADGWQPEDVPAIRRACREIRRELVELEDVELDIDAARRALTCGRNAVVDDRFRARQNALNKAKAATQYEWEAA